MTRRGFPIESSLPDSHFYQRSCEEVAPVDVEYGSGHEFGSVRGQVLERARQLGRAAPAVQRRMVEDGLGRAVVRIQGSASGDSNQPGATTFTVIFRGARSSARAFAIPTRPALDAL